jgi:hypothetical protein
LPGFELRPQARLGTGGAFSSVRTLQMNGSDLVTDADLARARTDADFRQKLVTQSLELLLAELNKLQRVAMNTARDQQMREGAELAVKLADLLRHISERAPNAA